jgi:hypothetical protein
VIHAPDRIRFDDAIWANGEGNAVQKFTKNVNWCLRTNVPLTPAVLCESSNEFPDGITWMYEKTREGIIYPDLHGWDHGPYHERTQVVIEEHLDMAQMWFQTNLGVPAIRWVTPHGSNSIAMQAAAAKYGLVIETTEAPVVDQKVLDTQLRQTENLHLFDGKVIMVHYWERGLRLYRMARIIEHQGVEEAMEATRSELSKKDWGICWNNWGSQ